MSVKRVIGRYWSWQNSILYSRLGKIKNNTQSELGNTKYHATSLAYLDMRLVQQLIHIKN